MGPAQEEPAVFHVRAAGRSRGHLPGHESRGEAGAGLGAVVRRAEGVGQALEDGAEPLGVAAEEKDGLGAVLGLISLELLCDGIQGLVPGDGLVLPAAPGTGPLQGRLDAVLPVDILPVGCPLGAEQSLVQRMVFVSLHLDDHAVLHIAVDAAVGGGGTDITQTVPDFDAGLRTGNLCLQKLFLSCHKCLLPVSAGTPR